ncbi:MAG: nucleotide exchange factor GrpE [Spirochaetaceae bacterium]|nr:nucleotide exchange factor GrpE [Spirochaetaceae bacterium]
MNKEDEENKKAECAENSCNEEKVKTEEEISSCSNGAEENNNVIENLKDKLKKSEEEIAGLRDNILRKQADFDNFRKRVIKEKEETIKYGNTNLLLDLVNIIDDFERAINSSADSKDFEKFYKGIELIEKQFSSMLEKKWNLVKFAAAGDKFDPEKHEAFMKEEKEGITEPVVAEVFQYGYMLNNRAIRHAKIKVFMPKNEATAEHAAKAEVKKEDQN